MRDHLTPEAARPPAVFPHAVPAGPDGEMSGVPPAATARRMWEMGVMHIQSAGPPAAPQAVVGTGQTRSVQRSGLLSALGATISIILFVPVLSLPHCNSTCPVNISFQSIRYSLH